MLIMDLLFKLILFSILVFFLVQSPDLEKKRLLARRNGFSPYTHVLTNRTSYIRSHNPLLKLKNTIGMKSKMNRIIIETMRNIPELIAVLDSDKNAFYIEEQIAMNLAIDTRKQIFLNDILAKFGFVEKKIIEINNTLMKKNDYSEDFSFQLNGVNQYSSIRIIIGRAPNSDPYYMVFLRDNGLLKDYKDQAELANITKSQFLANINHELRTPIIGILGALSVAESQITNMNDTLYDNYCIIRESSEHLLTRVNEILYVSDINFGANHVCSELCNLNDLLESCISLFDNLLTSKGLKLTYEIDTSMPAVVELDQLKLRQIIISLLQNAIKFTNAGTINICAWVETGSNASSLLRIDISDTGIGINDDNQANIFEPFIQGDNSSTRMYGGTGSGLFICKKLLQNMGGKISFESKVNCGSTFSISLPVKQASDDPIRFDKIATNDFLGKSCPVLELNPNNLLLVEDNHLSQQIISQMLSDSGYNVYVANNGLECLRILIKHPFDLILMDMQMPQMDGYEATKFIRENSELQSIPIIAMTANVTKEDKAKCFAVGCTSYIAKPFSKNELLNEIDSTLNPSGEMFAVKSNSEFVFSKELIVEFYNYMDENIKALFKACNDKDIPVIKSISHDIKGTAGLYGYKSLSDQAALIEVAASENNYSKLANLVNKLCSFYKQFHVMVS